MFNYNVYRKLPCRLLKNAFLKTTHNCNSSTRCEVIERQNVLFNMERKRQKEAVGRVEKITVKYEGVPERKELVMNKNISTPYDCAKHLNETIMKQSAVSLINGETLWHMHRPLPDSCRLDFLHFTVPQPAAVNKVFWRSCSFLLGAMVNVAFKDNINVHLHSFPSPNVRSGSFVYDVELGLDNWTPTQDEMRVLSVEMIKILQKNLPIEYLNVSKDLAQEIFNESRHKHSQIPNIAEHNEDMVTLYRVGNHIDISKGPMIADTSQVGRCTVAAVHKLNVPGVNLYRFQGVALPQQIRLNHFAYSILEDRAKKFNPARIPNQDTHYEDHPIENRLSQ